MSGQQPDDTDDGLREILMLFRDRLRWAKSLYHEEDDGGREGANAAVNAAAELVQTIREFNDEGLGKPLVALSAALADLGDGSQHPMLKPVPAKGRRLDTLARQGVRTYSAVAMELLMRGGFFREEAARQVARHLTKRGIDTPGVKNLTWRTVASWRDELQNRQSKGFAADAYREYTSQDIQILTNDKTALKKDVLARLDGVLAFVKAGNSS